MSLRLSSSQSSHFVSKWGGLGIPGSEIPTTGDNGGSPLVNDGIDSAKEYRIETVSLPSSGTLTVYPDTSYEYVSDADGTFTWTYTCIEDSVAQTPLGSVVFQVGSPAASFALSPSAATFSGTAYVSPVASLSISTAAATLLSGAKVSAIASMSLSTGPATFYGVAFPADSPASCAFAITTGSATFSGTATSSPVASFNLSLESVSASMSASGYSSPGGSVSLSQADIDAIAAAVWAHVSRSLSIAPPTAGDVADAVWSKTLP